MIDFMFELSTFTNQKELLESTQKGGAKSQMQKDLNQAVLEEASLSKYKLSALTTVVWLTKFTEPTL